MSSTADRSPVNVCGVTVILADIWLIILCMYYTQEEQLAIIKQHPMWRWNIPRRFHQLSIFVPGDHGCWVTLSFTAEAGWLVFGKEVILWMVGDLRVSWGLSWATGAGVKVSVGTLATVRKCWR